MNRRGFFGVFGMGIAGIALGQAIPFNRVWSFPSKIVIPRDAELIIPPNYWANEAYYSGLDLAERVEIRHPPICRTITLRQIAGIDFTEG